ncbi:MAG: hypothetical protein A3F72_04145 [Bacteroidetes bacterium RIFCSPLOWO2_12_FULL_35_15]|nr:MAG: hypothetical protein A3F72_04145 [Bacteroidetes bacterium RIFCSPLOWO2_12_FULL_35_15]
MKKVIKHKKDIIQKSLMYNNRNEEIEMLSHMVNSDYVDAIRNALFSRNISPSSLADDIGVSRSYVSQIFNGSRHINISFITRIRREYAIPLELIDTSRHFNNITFFVFVINVVDNNDLYSETINISNEPNIVKLVISK